MMEMMKAFWGPEGRPDFEKMKAFMEGCGKTQFGEEEIRMMKDFCGQQRMPNVEKMGELMERCGCQFPEAER